MIKVQETLTTNRSADDVFLYVGDYTNTAEWDPIVVSAERTTKGAVGVGSQFEIECALPVGSIKLDYEILEWVPNQKVVLTGKSSLLTVKDTIEIIEVDATSCMVSFSAEFDFSIPVDKIPFLTNSRINKLAKGSITGLKKALDNDFPAPAAKKRNEVADKLVVPGLALFSKLGYRLSKKHYNPISTNMRDKHVLITGATSGLGLSAAKTLAAMGAKLTLVARSETKIKPIVEDLISSTGNQQIQYELADLSLMADTQDLVSRLLTKNRVIDVLINNAGALFNPRKETAEGLERSFALLLLSPYILTTGIQPLIARSNQGRVINVVSGGMYSQKLRVKHLQSEKGKYSGSVAYARAKRALTVMTERWAEQWQEDGITVNAMHPGWADTPGVESALPEFHRITKYILRTPEEGADTIVWLAAAKEVSQQSGNLFLDREIHTTHLTSSTKEPAEERDKLEVYLDEQARPFTESTSSVA